MADIVRQQVAMSSPKWLIPTGIVTVFGVAAMTTNPLIPLGAGALIAYYGYRKLRRNGQLIERSYQDPRILFEWLDKEQQQVCSNFTAMYPPDMPMGKTVAKPKTPQQQETKPQKQSKGGKNNQPKKFNEQVEFLGYLANQLHLLISATSGSGKTHILTALIHYLVGRGDMVTMLDPKGHEWGALSEFVHVHPDINTYLKVFDEIHSELNKRKAASVSGKAIEQHCWFIFDEWFLARNVLSALDPKGEEYGVSPKDVERIMTEAIAAGRSLGVHLVIVSQSHFLQDLSISSGKNSFSSGLRDSICTLGLGCKYTLGPKGERLEGNSKSIVAMLQDANLIKNKKERDGVMDEYNQLLSLESSNRMFMVHGSKTWISQTPNLSIPSEKAKR